MYTLLFIQFLEVATNCSDVNMSSYIYRYVLPLQELEQHQIEEAVLALFHSILLHRASGKFRYQKDDSYHIEELATQDVKCSTFNLTYVSVVYHWHHLTLAILFPIFVYENNLFLVIVEISIVLLLWLFCDCSPDVPHVTWVRQCAHRLHILCKRWSLPACQRRVRWVLVSY